MAPPTILSRSEYYAPTPILRIDATKRLSDFNLAARVLLEPDLAGCQHRPVSHLFRALAARSRGDFPLQLTGVLSGDVAEPSASRGATRSDGTTDLGGFQSSRFQLCTATFGLVDIRSTAFESIDADSGQPSGTTVFLEIQKVEQEQRFHDHLRRQWQQQIEWDIYAVSYDRVLPKLPYYQEVIARHVQALSVPRIVEIVDVGGGTGNVAIPLVKKGKRVTVVDISRAMLDKLRCKLRVAEQLKACVLEQSAEDLSQLGDASFDGVNILLALFDMADPYSALNEAIRVLRPGGLLVVTEPKRSFNLQALVDRAVTSLRQSGLYESLEEDWQRVVRVNRAIDPSSHSLLFIDDIRHILHDAGFLETRTEDSHFGNCMTVWARKPEET